MSLSLRLFDELFDFEDEFECFFRPFTNKFEYLNEVESFLTDLYETRNEYKIVMDIPGIKKRDIKVDADFDHMDITVTKKLPHDKKMNFLQRLKDRRKVLVTRTIDFPSRIDPTQSKVRLEDGVLTITVPKASSSQRVSLKVQ